MMVLLLLAVSFSMSTGHFSRPCLITIFVLESFEEMPERIFQHPPEQMRRSHCEWLAKKYGETVFHSSRHRTSGELLLCAGMMPSALPAMLRSMAMQSSGCILENFPFFSLVSLGSRCSAMPVV